jgi:hypothetical protein
VDVNSYYYCVGAPETANVKAIVAGAPEDASPSGSERPTRRAFE